MAKKVYDPSQQERDKNVLGDNAENLDNIFNYYESIDPSLKGEVSREQGIQNKYNVDYDKYKGNFGYESINARPQVQLGDMFLNEAVALNQGTFNKVWKTPFRIVGKAATEIGKIPGYLGGIAGWMTAGGFDSKQFGDYVDNAWVQAFDSLDESIKSTLPVYRTKAAQEAGVWSQLTDAGFWATEGADGVGFLLSMFAPGAALKGAKFGSLATKGVNKLGIKAGTNFANKVDDFGSVVLNTVVEAGAEGVEVYNKVYNDLISKGVGEDAAKQQAGEAASNTFVANAVLLTVPNYLSEKWLFNGFKDAKTLSKSLFNESGEFITDAAKKSALSRIGNVGATFAKGFASEGLFEEGMQYATSKYFEGKAAGESEFSDNPFMGILESYMDSWDELDFQKSVMLGGLLGGGMSAFGAYQERKMKDRLINGGTAFKPANRFIGAFKKEREASEGLRKILHEQYINRYGGLDKVLNPDGSINETKRNEWIAEQVSKGTIEAHMHLAAMQGDQTSYEYLKNYSDFNYMLPYLRQEGGLQALKTHINKLSENEFKARQAAFGEASTVNLDQVKADLLQKADKFQAIYDRVSNHHPYSAASKITTTNTDSLNSFKEKVFSSKLQHEIAIEHFTGLQQQIASKILDIQANPNHDKIEYLKADLSFLEKQKELVTKALTQNIEDLNNLSDKKYLQEKLDEYVKVEKAIEEEAEVAEAESRVKPDTIVKDTEGVQWKVKASQDGKNFSLVAVDNESTIHPSIHSMSRVEMFRALKDNKISTVQATPSTTEVPVETTSSILTSVDPNDDTALPDSVQAMDSNGRKRSLDNLFNGLASNQEDQRDKTKRYYKFLQDVNLDKGDYSVQLVKGVSEFGNLLDETDEKYQAAAIASYKEAGETILAVVINKKGQPVDQAGKPISAEEVATKGVFAPLGIEAAGQYGARSFASEAEIEQAKKAHLQYRERTLSALSKGEKIIREIAGKSTGVPKYAAQDETGEIQPVSLELATGSTSLEDFEFWGSTDGNVYFSDGKARAGRNGFLYTYHKPSGNVYAIKARKLDDTDVNNVINLFATYIKGLKVSNGKIDPASQTTASKLSQTNKSVFTHINEITRWTGTNKNKLGEELVTNDSRRFHWAKSTTVIPTVNVGGKIFSIADMDANGQLTMNAKFEAALKEFLPNQYRNLITKDTNEVKDFVELTSIDKSGNIKSVIHSAAAGGYHNVLMKIAGTRIIPKDAEDTQFLNRYLIMEVPQSQASPEKKDAASVMKSLFGNQEDLIIAEDGTIITTESPSTVKNDEPVKDILDTKEDLPTDGSTINDQDFPEDQFRLVTDTYEGVQNLNQETAWLHKVLPEIPLEVVDHLIKGRAFGMFSKNAIYLYRHAEKGTLYHEAFHAVWRLYTTEAERAELINAYKKFSGSNKTDNQIEEDLAEDFRLYKLGRPVKTSPKIKKWYDKILDAIRAVFRFFSRQNTVSDYDKTITPFFQKIDRGEFAEVPLPTSSDFSDDAHRVSIGGNTTAGFTQEVLSSVDYYFFTAFKNAGYSFESLFHTGEVDLDPIYQQIENTIKQKYSDIQGKLSSATTPEAKLKYQTAVAGLKIIIDNFNTPVNGVKALHLSELLKQYNIEHVDFDSVSQNDSKESKDSAALMSTESLKISAKSSASKAVRFAVGTLPEVGADGKLKLNSMGMPYTAEFGKMFNIMVNKFSNLYRMEDMIRALEPMIRHYPAINRLLANVKIAQENFNSLTIQDANMILQFMQAFAKNKNNFNIATISKEGSYKNVHVGSQRLRARVMGQWRTKGANLYEIKDGVMRFRNPDAINADPKSITEVFQELSKVGISFNALDYTNLTAGAVRDFFNAGDTNAATFRNKAAYLLRSLQDRSALSPFAEELDGAGNYENMMYFVDLESATSYDVVENQHFNIDGERVYDNTQFNGLTFILSDLNNSVSRKDLYSKLPHLDTAYSKNSLIVNRLYSGESRVQGNKVKFTILEGLREQESGRADGFSKLKTADKYVYTINEGLNGNYVFLRASDNAVERSFNLGRPLFHISEVAQDMWADGVLGYLADELSFVSDPRIKQFAELEKASEGKGIVLDIIKASDPALHTLLLSKASITSADNEHLVQSNKDAVVSIVKNFFQKKTDKMINELVELRILDKLDGAYSNHGISSLFLSTKPSNEELNAVIQSYVVNNFMINVEQTKLFTGHPQAYKSVDNMIKRMSGLTGTKKVVFADNKINNLINEHLVRTDGKKSSIGDQAHNATLRTAVFADVIVKLPKKYIDHYAKHIGADRAELYKEINEADAQGYITLDEYREILFRSGDWTIELEALYQKELGNSEMPNTGFYGSYAGMPVSEILKKAKKPVVFNPLKPQYFGPMAEEDLFIPGFYKLSVLPLLPSLMKSSGATRGLDKLRGFMQKNQVGIAVFESGNKVGTKLNNGKIQPLYNESGEVDLTGAITQETYYKYWGIQLETGFKVKDQVVSGTQMLKHVINSAFSAGKAKAMRFVTDYKKGTYSEASAEETEKKVLEYIKLSAQRIAIGKEELIKELGLTKTDTGYQIDPSKIHSLIKTLRKEAVSRDLPQNIIDGIEMLGASTVGIDIIPNSDKMENILASIADSRTISRKRHGGAKVQGAGTMFETAVSRDYDDGVLNANDLSFYYNEEGQVSQMEVYLPHYFKKMFGNADINDLDPRLVANIIGFRIPTQGLNSIDSIKIKGFLPESAGELIIMPSAITVKAGSDYDIDKMNLYLPNFKMVDGKPQYIEYTEGSTDIKAIDNRLNELMKDFVMSPDNFAQLIDPIDAKWMKDLANEINPEIKESEGFAAIGDRTFLMDVTERNLVAKALVGITALQSTNNVFSQLYNFKLAPEVTVLKKNKEVLEETKIYLEGAKQDEEGVSISEEVTADGRLVSQTLSQLINAAVDAAKDPYIVRLGIRESTAGAFMFLIRSGVSVETAALFMNQPIVKEYIRNQAKYESHLAEVRGPKRYKDEIVDITLKTFGATEPSKGNRVLIKNSQLKSMLSQPIPSLQGQILSDFLRYQEIGKKISDAIQGTTYDTKAPKNTAEMMLRLTHTSQVIRKQEIQNYEKLFNADGFMQEAYSSTKESLKMLTPLFLSMKNRDFMDRANNLAQFLVHPLNRKSNEEKTDALNKFKRDYTLYVVQNSPYYLGGVEHPALSTEISYLFKGENSMAKQLVKIKKAFPQNALLEALNANFGEDIDNISINLASHKDDLDGLTHDWNMLMQNFDTKTFAMDLIKFALAQSGNQGSPISFVSLIPVQYMAEMINSAQSNHTSTNGETMFLERFFLNNADDETLVPKVKSLDRGSKVAAIYPIFAVAEVHPEHKKVNNIANEKERTAARKELRQKGIPYTTGKLKLYKNPSYKGTLTFSGEIIGEETAVIFDQRTSFKVVEQKGFKNFRNNQSMFNYGQGLVQVKETPAPKTVSSPKVENTETPSAEDIAGAIPIEQLFNEADKKEAEEQQKKCNKGKNNKFGR